MSARGCRPYPLLLLPIPKPPHHLRSCRPVCPTLGKMQTPSRAPLQLALRLRFQAGWRSPTRQQGVIPPGPCRNIRTHLPRLDMDGNIQIDRIILISVHYKPRSWSSCFVCNAARQLIQYAEGCEARPQSKQGQIYSRASTSCTTYFIGIYTHNPWHVLTYVTLCTTCPCLISCIPPTCVSAPVSLHYILTDLRYEVTNRT